MRPLALCRLGIAFLLTFTLFAGPSYAVIRLVPLAGRFSEPVGLFHAGDGSGRLFIVEQAGVVRIWQEGKISTFLDLRDRVTSGGEKGLLGLSFHPTFSKNGRFFVNYTSKTGGLHTVISEWRVNPTRASGHVDRKSERILLTIPQPYANHNGGQIAFGPDGYLYIGMGDGGSANDPHGHGQNRESLLGKMLRIDVNRRGRGKPYGIPPDNPFMETKRSEIWALGLRNPWRFSFDRGSGLLYAGDVGQDAREEIDVIRKGKNYGWNVMEGTICARGMKRCNTHGLTPPIFDYPRSEGTVAIGGYVYRGRAIPMLFGYYIYGDFGNGKIWALRYDGERLQGWSLLLSTGRNISAFGEDEAGEMYVVDYNGTILKIVPQEPK